jgi:hypothetical protein
MSCYGCEENMPNQLAHMDFGGCLYNERPTLIQTPPPSPDFPVETPPLLAEAAEAPEFIPLDPVGCAVCVTQAYFGETVGVRRASGNTARCQQHLAECAYCGRPECEDNAILCEGCSYSGAGNAFIVQAFLEPQTLCLYDRSPSSHEAWECGCALCIQEVAAVYQNTAVNSDVAFSLQ